MKAIKFLTIAALIISCESWAPPRYNPTWQKQQQEKKKKAAEEKAAQAKQAQVDEAKRLADIANQSQIK